jgi:hypothetical protein
MTGGKSYQYPVILASPSPRAASAKFNLGENEEIVQKINY